MPITMTPPPVPADTVFTNRTGPGETGLHVDLRQTEPPAPISPTLERPQTLAQIVAGGKPSNDPSIYADEKRLIQGLRARKNGAYRYLVDTYSPKLLRLATRIVHDATAAQDIVQETLVAVMVGIDKFQGHSGLFTWIYRIALNFSKMWLRNACQKRRASLSEVPKECWKDSSSSPEDKLQRAEMRVSLERCFLRLSEEQRDVYSLLQQGLTPWEISEQLGIPLATVRTRLFRMKNILRRILKL